MDYLADPMVIKLRQRQLKVAEDNGEQVLYYGNQTHPLHSCETAMVFLGSLDPRVEEGLGFSRWDAEYGLKMREAAYRRRYTPNEIACLVREKTDDKRAGLIRRYRKQLADAGFDLDALYSQRGVEKPVVVEPAEQILAGRLRRKSAKAWLISVHGVENWVALSLIIGNPKIEDDKITLTVPSWVAKKFKE